MTAEYQIAKIADAFPDRQGLAFAEAGRFASLMAHGLTVRQCIQTAWQDTANALMAPARMSVRL